MPSTIDETGFTKERYQELRLSIAEDWIDYGLPDVTQNVQSVPGRIVSQQASLQERNDALVQAVLDAFNPYAAIGDQQSRLAVVMGKRRNEQAKSTVTLTVTADSNGSTIPAGSQVSDGTDKVSTRYEVTIAPNGTGSVIADAVEYGAIEFSAGTLTQIKTPVFGWASVTNSAAAQPGTTRETDTELRSRMLANSSQKSSSTLGIYTALTEIDGVTYAFVDENVDDAVDAIGLRPHSVFPIVDGGSDLDVATALLKYVAGGISTNDTIPGATITTVNVFNQANRQNIPISFARPSDKDIETTITIKETTGLPPDYEQQIKDAVVDYVSGLEVGESLYSSDFYCPVNTVDGFRIISIQIAELGGVLGDEVVLLPFERPAIDEANITVTVQP